MQSPPSSSPYGGYIPNSSYIPMLFEYKLYRAKSLSKIWYFSTTANYIPSNTTSIYKFNKKEKPFLLCPIGNAIANICILVSNGYKKE